MPPDYVFPFQYEAIAVLRKAIERTRRTRARLTISATCSTTGSRRKRRNIGRASAALDPNFAIVHRNLAVAYQHDGSGSEKAVAELEKAVSLDRKYPLHFTELDELYETMAVPPEKRLALLEQNHADRCQT